MRVQNFVDVARAVARWRTGTAVCSAASYGRSSRFFGLCACACLRPRWPESPGASSPTWRGMSMGSTFTSIRSATTRVLRKISAVCTIYGRVCPRTETAWGRCDRSLVGRDLRCGTRGSSSAQLRLPVSFCRAGSQGGGRCRDGHRHYSGGAPGGAMEGFATPTGALIRRS
jgi:hypothetical protein